MRKTDTFDPEGVHHAECFGELTEDLQETYTLLQECLQNVVDIWNPGKFIPTSGYRCVHGNSACGGAARSRHLWALARDFVAVGGGNGGFPPRVPRGFRVVKSKGCWHVMWNLRSCK